MKILLLIISATLISYTFLNAQAPEWIVFNTANSGLPDNHVQKIVIDKNNVKWIGTMNGLVRFDDFNWAVYDSISSGLPSSSIYSIYADENNVWAGTTDGLAKYDGTDWQAFDNKDNIFLSPLIVEIVKDNNNDFWVCSEMNLVKLKADTWVVLQVMPSSFGTIHSFAIDNEGALWGGEFDHLQFNGSVWKDNGTEWIPYQFKNYPPLISSFPYAIAIDDNNTVWIGTGGTTGGTITRIENNKLDIFTAENAGFPIGGTDIAFEGKIKWIAGGTGLTSFDDVNWKNFNTGNSGLPDNYALSVAIDSYGNKWIGTAAGGLAVYKEGGVITSIENDNSIPAEYKLYNNFPNPFNPSTKIKYSLPKAANVKLNVYNILGEIVSEIFSGVKDKGMYEFSFNASSLPSGIYFCRMEASALDGSEVFSAVQKMIYQK